MAALRFALVGCGRIAEYHYSAVKGVTPCCCVTALVDIDREAAEAMKKKTGAGESCKVYLSLEEALKEGDFEAVVIMVPHNLHEELALKCLEAGKHVLLEKPATHTLESCKRLLDASEKLSPKIMIGENAIYWPEVEKACSLIEEGQVGELYCARSNYWESVGRMDFANSLRPDDWVFDPVVSGGGVLMQGATHWIRPLSMWMGEIDEVMGVVDYPYKDFKGESLSHAIIRFRSGKTATLSCHFMPIPMTSLPFFQIFGTEGEIMIRGSFDGGLTCVTNHTPNSTTYDTLGGYLASFQPQMQAFVDAVLYNKPVKNTVQCAMGEIMVATAIYKSVKTKRWEKVTLENLLTA